MRLLEIRMIFRNIEVQLKGLCGHFAVMNSAYLEQNALISIKMSHFKSIMNIFFGKNVVLCVCNKIDFEQDLTFASPY